MAGDRLVSYIHHLGEERIKRESEHRKTAKEKPNSLVKLRVEIPGMYVYVRLKRRLKSSLFRGGGRRRSGSAAPGLSY